MYNAIGKSNEELFQELTEKMLKGEKITIQDIRDIVETRSIVDTVASDDALTIFYSGESELLINTLAANADDSVRVIRRTEAFEFVSWFGDDQNDILEYVLSQEKIKQEEYEEARIKILYEQTKYVDGAMVGAERYKLLSATDKMELKEIDKVVRDLTVIGERAYSSNIVDAYLGGSGKTIDELGNMDKALIGWIDQASNSKTADAFNAIDMFPFKWTSEIIESCLFKRGHIFFRKNITCWARSRIVGEIRCEILNKSAYYV